MRYQHEYVINKKLQKDMVHKKLAGVCGGLANYYGLPRFGVRLAVVVSMFVFPVVVGVAYVVATLVMPKD
ncbi:PspC domain-containing protein [Pseudocolwellia sp. HL-MZ19]|uniref:PspC domain-containing protein n=1 Tax=unclassified Pseudocolwellia TaxID=2848178 RepID=UPI003CFA9D20